MNVHTKKLIIYISASLLLLSITGLVIWLVTRRTKTPTYYTCNGSGVCVKDTSGNKNYPNDPTCGGKCKPPIPGDIYYTCNGSGVCVKDKLSKRPNMWREM